MKGDAEGGREGRREGGREGGTERERGRMGEAPKEEALIGARMIPSIKSA